jgi:hypothetical protein
MMSQKLSEIEGKKAIAVISPLVETMLLFRGVERRFVPTATWSREQYAQGARGAVGLKEKQVTVRRLGGEEDSWEVRAGHTYELLETTKFPVKVHRAGHKTFDLNVAGPDSIGDVAAEISRDLKLQPWEQVHIRRKHGKLFYLEKGGAYTMTVGYDPDADSRLRLRIRYDALDRTFLVEDFIFDQATDPNRFFADLKKELEFDLPRPTQCTYTPPPWASGQEIVIATQETGNFGSAKEAAWRQRTFIIGSEEGNWQSREVLSPYMATRDQVWAQLRERHDLLDLDKFQIVQGNPDITNIQMWPSGAIEMVALL